MPSVSEIAAYFERVVPSRLKLDFDNVGLLAGFSRQAVRRVLLSLDITSEVIAEAARLGAELIVSHHPLILEARKSVADTDPTGKRITELLRNGLSAICLHTNLDSVPGGVSDALAEAVGAEVLGVVDKTGETESGVCGLGRVCKLPESLPLMAFLASVETALNVSGLRYYDAGRPVKRLVVCGGAGGEQIYEAAKLGCDTCLTGEIKYHHWLDGKELGLNLVEADHFCTENVVLPLLAELLRRGFPGLEVRISSVHDQTARGF